MHRLFRCWFYHLSISINVEKKTQRHPI